MCFLTCKMIHVVFFPGSSMVPRIRANAARFCNHYLFSFLRAIVGDLFTYSVCRLSLLFFIYVAVAVLLTFRNPR